MSAIFNVFHVSQLKKCLRVPGEQVQVRDINFNSNLTYEERPVVLLDSSERVTRNRVIRFHKVMWCNQGGESDATLEREYYLCEVYPSFYEKW
jgi:hypothetical protein